MTTDIIGFGTPFAFREMKCIPCNIVPSRWPYNPDFWVCPKCDSTYVKKYLFNRVKGLDKSTSQYDLRVNILQGPGLLGYIQISRKAED